MFDLTSRNSFKNAVKWKKDVDSKCFLEDGAPVPCMLLANKVSSRSTCVEAVFCRIKHSNKISNRITQKFLILFAIRRTKILLIRICYPYSL